MRNNTYANIVLYKSGGNMKGIFGVRYSDYLDEFKCIGGKCEDTCCKEWSVYVDKDTYEKYDSIKDKDIRKFVTDNRLGNSLTVAKLSDAKSIDSALQDLIENFDTYQHNCEHTYNGQGLKNVVAEIRKLLESSGR